MGGGGKQLTMRNYHTEDTESTDTDIFPQLELEETESSEIFSKLSKTLRTRM